MLGAEIERLKEVTVKFSQLVETMVSDSMRGLVEKDASLLRRVIKEDEEKANAFELQIEEMVTSILARFQPLAKDLRTVLMIYRMSSDLERMGDHSVNISESSLFLIERPQVKALIDLPRMAQETVEMLRDSIKSFMQEDAELAEAVCERDDFIDSLRDQIMRELITYMTSDPSTIERSMHLIRISNNLERIADLSTNIAEDVVFMVKGELIRHRGRPDR